MPKHLMILGTASHVGKSVLVAALCHIFSKSTSVAPFKAQNMSLNSWITEDGGEIGIAQAIQAWAAGIEPTVDMNPVLLKPKGDHTSQVIILGRPAYDREAGDYYESIDEISYVVDDAVARLEETYDLIVIEGAGGAAEINLYDRDIVNIGCARSVKPAIILVGDIERGGVFASLYGTMALLPDDVRTLVKGFIINKFRGDYSILEPGVRKLEELTGLPVFGVVPYADIAIPSEDSVSISDKKAAQHPIDIAVIRLSRISNFTDFEPLEAFANVRYVPLDSDLGDPDVIIIPGTKNTTADLLEIMAHGMDQRITEIAKGGAVPVIGICGGYQMLGRTILDCGFEDCATEVSGMGLLDVTTRFESYEKQTRQVVKRVTAGGPILGSISGETVSGYEIHTGETVSSSPVFEDDGCISESGLVFGTYLHGVFENENVRRALFEYIYARKGISLQDVSFDVMSREEGIREFAEVVEGCVDVSAIRKLIG
ncbi:MAG: cobyric acid synthase CobQ [Euryarchaeota archaeon]|nr:cobyric acid synthase CobQ [Euryarchaeota archaeon]